MSTEQNKAVVRRFFTETLAGGDVGLVDELLAPDYYNPIMGGTDRAGFKAVLSAMRTVISDMCFDIQDLVAEGDAVVARFTWAYTLASGKKIEGLGLTYYRLAGARIVADDHFQAPDPTPEIVALMAPPSA
jgi:predicted ester cyclase